MTKASSVENDIILYGSLNQGILKLAVPSMISMVSIMLFEIIDLFWIGRLGAPAVAALGASSFVVWTVKALANCTSAGINALVARVAGSQNRRAVQMWASQGFILTGVFALGIMLAFYLLNLFIFSWLGLEPEVALMAQRYTFIMVLSIFFVYETFALDTIFRSMGNTFIPMVIIVTCLTLNAILDPFFIFGWLGFPKMGMPGGALASLISHLLGMFLLLSQLSRIKITLKWKFERFARHAVEIFRIGIPIGLLEAVFSTIYIVLSKNIAYFGTVPMAAISAAHRLEGLPFFISFGFSVAVATFVGQNLGNGNPRRAEKAVNLALSYAVIFLFLISIAFILWGRRILGLFIVEQSVIEVGYQYLLVISIFEIFLAPEVILQGAFTGAGDTRPPFFISISFTFLRIPFAYLFSIVLGYGVLAIWWVIGISTFLKGVGLFLWFRRGQWKLKQVALV